LLSRGGGISRAMRISVSHLESVAPAPCLTASAEEPILFATRPVRGLLPFKVLILLIVLSEGLDISIDFAVAALAFRLALQVHAVRHENRIDGHVEDVEESLSDEVREHENNDDDEETAVDVVWTRSFVVLGGERNPPVSHKHGQHHHHDFADNHENGSNSVGRSETGKIVPHQGERSSSRVTKSVTSDGGVDVRLLGDKANASLKAAEAALEDPHDTLKEAFILEIVRRRLNFVLDVLENHTNHLDDGY